MKTCFSIMPFSSEFDDISEIVANAARASGLEYIRSDMRQRPGNVMDQVLHEIRHASVVVADVTGHNANVFYELGIAHQILGANRVVIITQSIDKESAYDIHHFSQLRYAHSTQGRIELGKRLPALIKEAVEASEDREYWNITRGRIARTRMIVRDIQRLISSAGPTGLRDLTIRVVAGLSSLAISDNEPADPVLGTEYLQALLDERNALRNALLLGANLKAVLNPPVRSTIAASVPIRLSTRLRRLIGLLQGQSDIEHDSRQAADDLEAIKKCTFALSSTPMPNLFILGEVVAYEGMKRGGGGGFEMTHCETNIDELRIMIEQFDRFFDASLQEMQAAHPPDGCLTQTLQHLYGELLPQQA